jgi:leucyl-tRNA synthetase
MKMLNALETFAAHDIAYRRGELGDSIDAIFSANLQRAFAREEAFRILLVVLSPIAPHITHALWKELGYGDDILTAPWPQPLEAALVQDEIELVIQVNGKLRGSMTIARDADRGAIEKLALQQPNVQKYLEGVSVKKVIVVPGKLVNVVVG